MCKDTSKNPIGQEKTLFSLPGIVSGKEIRVDFNAPDISSNGGLLLAGDMKRTLAWRIGSLIPDSRKREFVHHTYMEMVCQRVGQILCGYEDANDCDRLRGDSALKMSCGRKPSDGALCSQPTRDHGDGSHDPFEDEGAIVDLSRYSVRWSTRAMTFSLALPHGSEVSATVQNHWHQIWHYQQGKKWITRTVPMNREMIDEGYSMKLA